MLNSTVQKQPLLIARASTFIQAVSEGCGLHGLQRCICWGFCNGRALRKAWRTGPWQCLAVPGHGKQLSGCIWPQPCCTTHGTSVFLLPEELVLGCHSHSRKVPLAQNFLSSFKELVCKGFICVSLVVDLFVTHTLMMANLMPLQDLFLEWFSCSFLLCISIHIVAISQNASSAQARTFSLGHGPNRKIYLATVSKNLPSRAGISRIKS